MGRRKQTMKLVEIEKGKKHVVKVQYKPVIDHDIIRTTAKASFNYLAWAMGPQLVLGPEFDPIRKYILHGGDEMYVTPGQHYGFVPHGARGPFPYHMFGIRQEGNKLRGIV